MQRIKKFVNTIGNLNRNIIALIFIIFSFLTYLSIPALYKYESVQKQLTKKILNDFGINLALSNDISYHILPTPNFAINDSLITFDNSNESNKFGEVKKVKIFLSLKNLFQQEKLEIKEIKLFKSNFIIDKTNYKDFVNYLKKKTKKKILIEDSKVFFKNFENSETISIATISNAKIHFDDTKKLKRFDSKGLIFNTNYNLNYNQSLENLNLKNISLFFKELDLKIKNEFIKNVKNNKFYGQTYISFLREKIKFKYHRNGSNFFFENEKNKNLNFSGTLNTTPFFFNLQMFIKDLDINTMQILFSKLESYVSANFLLNKNFNGDLKLNIQNINDSKYIKSFDIIANFTNGKINLNKSKIHLNKLGYVELKKFNISNKKNKVYINSSNLFKIKNLKEFNRILQLPKKKRIEIENIYFELDKIILEDGFSLNRVIINNQVKRTELKTFDLTNNVEKKNIKSLKNWFELKVTLKEILTEIN